MPIGNYDGDMDALVENGIYRVGENENLPTQVYYSQAIVCRGKISDTVVQIVIDYDSATMMFRGASNASGQWDWVDWQQVAIAAPPQEFDLPLAEEMQPLPAYGSNKYWKNQFNEVTLTLSVTKTDMNTNDIPNGAFLATLPAGFRPLTPVSGAAYVDRGEDDNVYPGFIIINPDGSVRLFQAKQVPCSMVIASTSFVAAT